MRRFTGKFIKRIIKDEQGAVSVYLIILTLIFFIFNAVLIDFARVLVAQKRVDTAAKAAARSTMASFNSDVRKYGLFVLDTNDPNAIFQDIFDKNLNMDDDHYFGYVNVHPENSDVKSLEAFSLLFDETRKNQILEEMKYRAPIEFMKEIVNQFTQVSQGMEAASEFAHGASEINDLVKKRKTQLNEVEDHLKKAKKDLGDVKSLLTGSPSPADRYPEVANLADIIQFYDKNPNDEEDPEGALKKWGQFLTNATILLGRIKVGFDSAENELNNALSALDKVKDLNNQINDKLKETRDNTGTHYGDIIDESNNGATSGAAGQIDQLTQQLNDYVYKDSFFTDLKGKIQKAKNDIGTEEESDTLLGTYHRLLLLLSATTKDPTLLNMLKVAFIKDFNTVNEDIDDALKYLNTNRKIPNGGNEEKMQNDAEKDAKDELNRAKDEIDKLIKTADLANDQRIYIELKGLVDKYNGQEALLSPTINEDDPSESAKGMMSIVDSLFSVLGDILKKGRDRAYINEYILTHFISQEPYTISDSNSFLYRNKQVEYILYGINKPGANYLAAYTELFALRFALNFLYALTKTTTPFPLVTFFVAVAVALGYTLDDMNNLVGNKPDYAIVYRDLPKLKFNYKDYLRLFLFMHPGEDKRLLRALAVVEKETGKSDLSTSPTYIAGKAAASVKLWFLPEAMKLLSVTGALSGKVKDGRYYISTDVSYSY